MDLADRLSTYALRLVEQNGPYAAETHADVFEDQFVELLDALALERVPAVYRLAELLSERGWSGWNRLKRDEAAE